MLLTPPGEPAPGSVPVEDLWVDGPGGPVHALVARPPGRRGPARPRSSACTAARTPPTRTASPPSARLWVDAGFVVVEVNYRGSTGYGSAWRDAIEGRPGLTELEDVAAVLDCVRRRGHRRPGAGRRRGLVVGRLPGAAGRRHAARSAGRPAGRRPVADYLAAYADEMEQLRAFDRALFGGSPEQVPEVYRDVVAADLRRRRRAPVLVLAGENDPRCPIRQIDNYLAALAAAGKVPTRSAGSTPGTARWWWMRRCGMRRPRWDSHAARAVRERRANVCVMQR